MDGVKFTELQNLVSSRLSIARKYLEESNFSGEMKKSLYEESEIPGFENRPMKFGRFISRDFAVMMTDIRRSTDIINSPDGTRKMFLIFYAYAAMVAKIVDSYNGTATEFLGDGVLNLFDTSNDKDKALRNAIQSSWEILEACREILNPALRQNGLPEIVIGIGIDFGQTIVTRFGHKSDNDLKAFGKCVYNVSKLCKGFNEVFISDEAQQIWPYSQGGRLRFQPTFVDSTKLAYKAYVA